MQPLIQAILFGELVDVENALTPHIDLTDYDDYGYTPLIEAVLSNKAEIVEFLLAQDIDVNQKDTTGRTPLHWAVDNNNRVISSLLLEHGANPNAYTNYAQPVGVIPWLRGQGQMLDLLTSHGADTQFIKDYVFSKLLAHRYQLKTKIDLLAPNKKFIELNLEGFILEATVNLIFYSLRQFLAHYGGREFSSIKAKFKILYRAFENTQALTRLQHYLIDPSNHQSTIKKAINAPLLILPVAYTGHAVCFAKVGNLLAKCDRGAYGKEHGSLTIYQIKNPGNFNSSLIQKLFFSATNEKFVHHDLNQHLHLHPMLQLPMPPQVIGNCAWANMEGIIPAVMLMLLSQDAALSFEHCERMALQFFTQWQRFDRARALDEMIQFFMQASPPRQASIAALLACVLFQYCRYDSNEDCEIARKIGRAFKSGKYLYVLEAYVKIHQQHYPNRSGKHFTELLDIAGIHL